MNSGDLRTSFPALLEESYALHADAVAYLAVIDESGARLAHAGQSPATQEPDVYVFEMPLAAGRGPHGGATPQIAGWHLRVGLYTAAADFIRRQALLHLAVSALAVAALLLLSLFLLRTLRRFLELKSHEHAEQHLRALGTMAAVLAHEIRNPLGAMKGLTQLAQEEIPPDHLAQPAMRTVVKEAERLERLVSNLLDFARPEKAQVREFEVGELMLEIGNMFRQRLRGAGILLEARVPAPLKVRSDPDGVRQVLLNVLANAADAMPGGGTVLVSAQREGRSRSVLIEVEDSGEGMGNRDPEELFQPFVTSKTRGTGLGLAVSRRIVEALGGTITMANAPGKGARCTIRIPDVESGANTRSKSRNASQEAQ